MSYRNLEIWKLARDVSIETHLDDAGTPSEIRALRDRSQIRRASKSIRANIVEGYGRRRYKAEYVKHLTYAQASCDETTDHLETLSETGSLTESTVFESISSKLQTLGKKLNLFIQTIERSESTGPANR
jgi:four helix bundle protein